MTGLPINEPGSRPFTSLRDQLHLSMAESTAAALAHAATHPDGHMDSDCAECVLLAGDCGIDLRRVNERGQS